MDTRSVNEDQPSAEGFAFARRVEERLEELGRDWAWLSRQAKISTSSLSEMRTKGRIPRTDRAIAIGRALGVDFEWLATGSTESRDRAAGISGAKEHVTSDQLALLRMYGRLSAREQEGVLALLAKLTGIQLEASLHAPGTATLQDGRSAYRGQEEK